MKNSVILETEKLSIGYSKTNVATVAENINLSLGEGKLISLIGANGVGKSTLLRTLTGIQKPLSGKVLVEQQDISSYKSQQLAKKLSVVLTEKLPPSNLTVYEIIALGRQPYTNWIGKLSTSDVAYIDKALKITQTDLYSDKKHFEISDGQLQKVMVARALAQDTSLIVLDEPTTHLDLQHKVSLFKLLKKLAHEQRKCILFSTHDIDMAIQLSDEMILMTSEHVTQDTVANFIQRKAFEKIFSNDDIIFDEEKVKFIFKNL